MGTNDSSFAAVVVAWHDVFASVVVLVLDLELTSAVVVEERLTLRRTGTV